MDANNIFSKTPQDLKRTLEDINRKMQEQEAQAKASSMNLPYIDLHNFPVDLSVLGMFTKQEALAFGAVPFYRENKDLRIGVTDPNNVLFLQKAEELSAKFKITQYFISQFSFLQTLQFFSKILRPEARHDEVIRVEKQEAYQELLKKLADPQAQVSYSASQWLETLFGAAMFFKSSDIHLEPEAHFFKVRFRVDGVLQDMLHLEKQLQNSVVTRIKILSKLKLNITDLPQDGRLTFYYLGQPVDVRVSTLPSAYGEELVLRLLGIGGTQLKLKDLGFRPEMLDIVHRQIAKPNGMIITTGPTGSGKTTTLYAFLNELNEPGVKIITLEDPVEYKLEGIVQTPIDHSHDFSFAKGLRAILRQDPDIVMVGEIRDQETAETAMQAALTGHLVLSTLHTNDAAGAIPRLANMGIKPFVMAPALSAVMAQRLVRKLCSSCKQLAVLSPMVLEKINYIFKQLPKVQSQQLPKPLQFYHSSGCELCHNLGYLGRVGIYEVIEVTEAIQNLINKQAPPSDFKKVALAQGMVTMAQDGLLKALDGITDVEEVFRVAGES